MDDWTFSDDERITVTREGDVESVAARMRDADKAEVWASHGMDPLSALRLSVRFTPAPLTVWKGDLQAAILGVVPVSAVMESGMVWLLGTDLIERYPVPFLRHSREVVRGFLQDYRRLFNYVDDRNRISIRWIKWCGFEKKGSSKGIWGDPFTLFEIRR